MKKNISKKIISIIILIIVAVFGGSKITSNTMEVKDDLEIHFIDVGQGDSTLLISKGETVLIDGGERHASSKVVSYLEKMNIEKIDYIVATHPHSDHISGLIGVMNKFEVKNVIDRKSVV